MRSGLRASHLIWQGIDPLVAIRYLGSAIPHLDAKYTELDVVNVASIGVLDEAPHADVVKRSWAIRSVGHA